MTAPPGTIVLGAYAARSCPVKTQNAFNPTLVVATATDDSSVDSSDGLAELFDGGAQFDKVVLDQLLDSCVGEVVDLRPVDLRPVDLGLSILGPSILEDSRTRRARSRSMPACGP